VNLITQSKCHQYHYFFGLASEVKERKTVFSFWNNS